jgi:hypothetical protein
LDAATQSTGSSVVRLDDAGELDSGFRAGGAGVGFSTAGRLRLAPALAIAVTSLHRRADDPTDRDPARSRFGLGGGSRVTAGIYPSVEAQYLIAAYFSAGLRLSVPVVLGPKATMVWVEPMVVVAVPLGST